MCESKRARAWSAKSSRSSRRLGIAPAVGSRGNAWWAWPWTVIIIVRAGRSDELGSSGSKVVVVELRSGR